MEKKYIPLSFFVLIFIIFGRSLWGSFVFDDRGILEHWDMLSNLVSLKETILNPYWSIGDKLYRPVTLLSYALNIIFLGGSALSFHLVNLLVYSGICVSLYLLIKRLFRREVLAIISAIIFLILPIHTEVVANITGRSELLALFFSLLALLEFTGEREVKWWRVGIWTFLALGSKETALAVVPLVGLVILIKEQKMDREVLERYFRSISAVVIGALSYLVLRFFVLGPEYFSGSNASLIENPLTDASTLERVSTAGSILWMYVSKTIYPVRLCSDYSYNQIPVLTSLFHTSTLLGLVVFLFGLVSVLFWKKYPVVSFSLGFFSLSFLLVSNFLFPIGTIAAERLFFYPSVGLAILLAYLLLKLPRVVVPYALLVILLVYGSVSFVRTGVWESEHKLFLNASECASKSVLSRSNSGASYLLLGELDKAEMELELSRNISPRYSKGLNNLGLVYWRQGKVEEAEDMYHLALSQKHPYSGAIENMVLLKLALQDEPGALRWLRIMYPNVDDSFLRNLF